MTNKPTKDNAPQAVPAGHNEVIYPREIPTHSVLHIVGHLRGQEVLTLPELGQHVATTIGCACELMKSSPTPVGSAAEASPYGDPQAMSNQELADALESAVAPQSGDAVGALPVWLIPILLDVVRRYFGF